MDRARYFLLLIPVTVGLGLVIVSGARIFENPIDDDGPVEDPIILEQEASPAPATSDPTPKSTFYVGKTRKRADAIVIDSPSTVLNSQTSKPTDAEKIDRDTVEAKDADKDEKGAEGRPAEEIDPVTLGPLSWMAEVPAEEQEAIARVFAKQKPVDPKLTPTDRRESINVIEAVVGDCLDELRSTQPDARGRIIVAWTASAKSGRGEIDNPKVEVNIGLRVKTFEACIESGAAGLRFQSERDGDPRRIRYPFFFDVD